MLRCPRCLSVALVCACFAQGVKAPPASVVSLITSPGFTVTSSSTASVNSTMNVVNTVLGKVYDVSPATKPVYGEHDTPVVYVWPPPDPTKT
jgi:hypothetical protein